MKRVIALAMVLVFAVAVAAQAQEPQSPTNAPAAPAAGKIGNIFSKASIDRAVVADKTLAVAPDPAPPVPKEHKSFFKTPWPYVIAGAVVAGVVVAVNHNGSGNGMTSGSGSKY